MRRSRPDAPIAAQLAGLLDGEEGNMADRHRILIVDDNEEVVAFYTEVLEANGYEHAVARNGKEAIEAMKASPPALVLLDIMMPRKSSLETSCSTASSSSRCGGCCG